MKFKKMKHVIAFVLISATIMNITGCGTSSTTTYSDTGVYFDTVISITVYDKQSQPYIQDCFDMAERYENLFSRTIADSDVSRINNADCEFVTCDPETIDLIETGLKYCELSNGAFDITVGTLSDLWDITNNPGVIPEQNDINNALATVDYHTVIVKGNQVRLTNENTTLDLGAIAKGYIADQMKNYLEEQGVESAMINLGGNVLTLGSKTDGSSFTVGVQKPFDETGNPMASVSISDMSVVSSGNYERYFELDGTIYHHILSTSDGYPIQNELNGVTIVSTDSVDGDALSTTCFAMGTEEAMKLLESMDQIDGIFITKDGDILTTSGIGTTIPFHVL